MINIHTIHTLTHTGPGSHGDVPIVLYVLVDHAGDHHGDDGVVPGGNEHESQTDCHAEKRQRPDEHRK